MEKIVNQREVVFVENSTGPQDTYLYLNNPKRVACAFKIKIKTPDLNRYICKPSAGIIYGDETLRLNITLNKSIGRDPLQNQVPSEVLSKDLFMIVMEELDSAWIEYIEDAGDKAGQAVKTFFNKLTDEPSLKATVPVLISAPEPKASRESSVMRRDESKESLSAPIYKTPKVASTYPTPPQVLYRPDIQSSATPISNSTNINEEVKTLRSLVELCLSKISEIETGNLSVNTSASLLNEINRLIRVIKGYEELNSKLMGRMRRIAPSDGSRADVYIEGVAYNIGETPMLITDMDKYIVF